MSSGERTQQGAWRTEGARSELHRLETAVLEAKALTPAQKQAAQQVGALVNAMAESSLAIGRLDERAFGLFLPRLDPRRRNQSVLIDGGRGAGKTTLLITLLDAFRQRLLGITEERATVPLLELIPRPEGSVVVPLEIIDLHVVRPGTSLVMSVILALHNVVRAINGEEEEKEGTRRAPFRPGPKRSVRTKDLHARWADLARAVAGWNGSIERRRATVDPEVFSLELAEETGHYRNLENAFAAFMETLVEDFERAHDCTRKPLFLLPIDDADMNPLRALELLQLLRTLYHPRLSFLLTGDTNLFLAALRADQLGTLWRPLQGLPALPPDLGPASYPFRLALEVYDRVLPPSHRCPIRPIAPEKRLDLPLEPRATAAHDLRLGESLRSILERIPTQVPTMSDGKAPSASMNLAALFDQEDGGRPRARLASLLPDRLRGLLDLGRALALKKEEPLPDAAEVCFRLFTYALERAPLAPEHQERLRRVVLLERVLEHGGVDRNRVVVAAHYLRWEQSYQEIKRFDPVPDFSIAARFPVSDRIWLVDPELGPQPIPLGETLIGSLILATDLAAEEGASGFIGDSPTPGPFDGVFVQVDYLSRSGLSLRFGWPLPEWDAFLDFELFRVRWLRAVGMIPPERYDRLAKAFLLLVLAVGSRVDAPMERTEELELSWDDVAARIEQATRPENATSRRSKALADWARSMAGLLAAPEGGLSFEDANDMLSAIKTKNRFAAEALRAQRRRHLRAVLERLGGVLERPGAPVSNARIDELIEELDAERPEYAWSREVGQVRLQREEVRADLATVFQRVKVAQEPLSFTRGVPTTLSGYLTSGRTALLAKVDADPGLEEAVAMQLRKAQSVVAVLAGLWRLASSEAGNASASFQPIVQLQPGHHVVIDARRATRAAAPIDIRNSFEIVGEVDNSAPLPSGLRAEIARTTTSVALPGSIHPSLSALLDVVYRLAWDITADQQLLGEGAAIHPQKASSWWEGMTLFFSAASPKVPAAHPPLRIQWPVVVWPALLEWELLDEAWRGVVERILKQIAANKKNARDNQRIVDQLAFHLLFMTGSLVDKRRPDRLDDDIAGSAARWGDKVLLDLLFKEYTNPPDVPRWRAYRAWFDRLPLMAAPESGLSAEVAQVILDAWPCFKVPNGELRRELWRNFEGLRTKRLHDLNNPRKQKASTLQSIDKRFLEHPWVLASRAARGERP